MKLEKPIRDVDAEIRINPDQVSVEGRVMQLRERQAIRDNRLPKLLPFDCAKKAPSFSQPNR